MKIVLAILMLLCPVLGYGQKNELTLLADKYGTDKGSVVHHFCGLYENVLLPVRTTATRICEIGVHKGASLRMWRDFFPNAVIYGIDIEKKYDCDGTRVVTAVADQANRQQLQSFITVHGSNFDFVLDDGGHQFEQQQVSFAFFFPM